MTNNHIKIRKIYNLVGHESPYNFQNGKYKTLDYVEIKSTGNTELAYKIVNEQKLVFNQDFIEKLTDFKGKYANRDNRWDDLINDLCDNVDYPIDFLYSRFKEFLS